MRPRGRFQRNPNGEMWTQSPVNGLDPALIVPNCIVWAVVCSCNQLCTGTPNFSRANSRAWSESVLQVIMCASRSVINVEAEACCGVVNDTKPPSAVLSRKRLLCLAHGSGLTIKAEQR